ncbi:MAG TPA: LysM peptidoglycan-binding domain-containing M23 family metallopeptidase [Terriglobia bacterium]|nr:LysM peptidoglycan-binding domain-containing M23 family metallopeptidase [Terriglobia bacterium]
MDRKTLSVTGLVALLTLAGCNESGRPLSDGTAGPAFNGQAPIMGVEQGNTYVVAAGDTVATIADRTHTPVRTLIDLNNLQPPYVLKSGQRLALQPGANTGSTNVAMGQSMVIPEASSNGAAAPTVAPSGGVTKAALPPLTAAKSAQPAAQTATTATQQATATQAPQVLQSQAQQSKTIATQSMSAANTAASTATQNAVGAANATATQAANQASAAADKATTTANTAAANAANKATTLPNGEPAISIPDFPDATAKSNAAANTASNAASSAASQVAAATPAPAAATGSGQFGWPVQGKVVSKFGATADGLRNDGINISAPAGAPVVAAADGVVAYAGNELRGFGNMILIRHADGWVTAYAHNESLTVKKGDTVKRGQTIARVGQTGNVTSPQLHFEIRKGTSAQDPTKYLGS